MAKKEEKADKVYPSYLITGIKFTILRSVAESWADETDSRHSLKWERVTIGQARIKDNLGNVVDVHLHGAGVLVRAKKGDPNNILTILDVSMSHIEVWESW